MESIAKVIEATGVTIEELFEPIRAGEAAAWRAATVPLMGFARAGAGGFFDDAGFPVGEGWERVELPGGAREGSYALRVQGDVILRVTFTASGRVQVDGVVHGLGHGLDEEARRVAQQIRFRPATRNGQAVDLTTNITITFQLA